MDVEAGESLQPFIDLWADHSPFLLAGGFSPESAADALDREHRDKDVLVAFVCQACSISLQRITNYF